MFDFRTLPKMGLGVGLDIHDTQPNLENILKSNQGHFDYLEFYTNNRTSMSEHIVTVIDSELPLLYHNEILDVCCPLHDIGDAQRKVIESVKILNAKWCVEEAAFRSVGDKRCDFMIPALLTEESLKVTIENLQMIQAEFPVPVFLENPPFQYVYGDLHIIDFMSRLAEALDTGFVLDLGHLYSYQLAAGLPWEANLDNIAADRIVEMHVAGGSLIERDGMQAYVDSHGHQNGRIFDETYRYLEYMLPRAVNLKAVTYEAEGTPDDELFENLIDLRARCRSFLEVRV
jgi:uncharacterized protein (UPF0276 family)